MFEVVIVVQAVIIMLEGYFIIELYLMNIENKARIKSQENENYFLVERNKELTVRNRAYEA